MIRDTENDPTVSEEVKKIANKALVSTSENKAFYATNCIDKHYWSQDEILLRNIRNELGKAEEKLFKKWNLKVEDPIDIDQIYGDIFDGFVEFTDIYNNAKDVSEITEDVISDAKNTCTKNFNILLDEYAERHNIGEDLLNNIKNDVPNLVSKYFDKAISKIFDNETRAKLEELYNTCNEAYEAKDYDKMDQASDTILEYCQNLNTFYRDEDLMSKLTEVTTKNEYIQNKIEHDLNPEISEDERELLNKLYNHQW